MRRNIVEWVRSGVSVSEVSRLTGLSRKTVYKWVLRGEASGESGLADHSRAPLHVRRFEGEAADWLLGVRAKHSTWGPAKLLQYAYRHRPQDEWPSRSTVAALLKRRGLVAARTNSGATRVPFRYAGPIPSEPNARWTMDFKGEFRLRDGAIAKPFTLRDSASRKILDIRMMPSMHGDLVRGRLERAFSEFGMPEEIQSDNGSPFASTGLAKLSRLSVWLLRNNVVPVLSRPGKPQDNGGHERMHRDYKAETTRPPAHNLQAQQLRSTRWLRAFNEERPHAALGGDVPDDHWSPSPRRYEPRLRPPEYPAWWETRRVDKKGDLSWRNEPLTCSKALREQPLGFEPVNDGLWRIHLSRFPIAILDERTETRILNL